MTSRSPFQARAPRKVAHGLVLIALFALFALLACNDDSNPVAPTPAIQISVMSNRVTLSWPAATGTVATYKLLRRENVPPANATDANAVLVYSGSALMVTEDLTQFLPNLTGAPHRYYYAVFGCDAGGQCPSAVATGNFAPSLVQCLQGGGYTIFWRHANATVCVDNLNLGTAAMTTLPNWWRVCATVCVPDTTPRQISDVGRNEATVIGQQMDRLAVPFGRVISSEFCRCLTTAQLANLGPTIEEAQELTYFVYDEANRCTNTFALLGQLPSPGANTALFSHVGFPGCVLGDLGQAQCAIYKPDGTGAVTFIIRVAWNAWASL